MPPSRLVTILRGHFAEEPGGPIVTTAATAAKPLTKKELAKFKELLLEKRRAVLERARKTLTEDMTLDTNDLADEMDLAASEYIQSFEFRLRGREKSLLTKVDLALKKIEDGTFGQCEHCDEPIGRLRGSWVIGCYSRLNGCIGRPESIA